MNPLFQKKANDDQDPIILPQDDNPQGDMLDPATQQTAPQPTAARPERQPIVEQERMAGKQATGGQDSVTREEYPVWFTIADALGGEVEPFDVYQGPYISVPGEDGRLFIITTDGLSAQVWNEKTNAISDEFLADSENEAVDAALSVMENPPANTLPYGSEREEQLEKGPDTSDVPDKVPAQHPDDWVPEFSEEDKVRLRGMGQIKGSKAAGAHTPWDVYLNGKWQNRVYYVAGMTADEVKRSLVNHDGLDPSIEVRSGEGRNVPGSVRFSNLLLNKESAGVPLNTGQYGQGASQVCYKCKQPIQQGQKVSWEGGVEAHIACPPPQQGNANEQSRIMFPKGQQPKKPQMGVPSQTPARPAAKPMYSSERIATRRKISGFVPATSWGVPQEYAHQVAHTLAMAGQKDFDVATDEELHVAFFSFGNEVEMEVCADIVCEYFGPQINASKGKWVGWQCRPERQPGVPVTHLPAKMNSKSAGVRAEGIEKLKALGIKNTADLDQWIKKNPGVTVKGPYQGKRYLKSRFEALSEICGEDAAIWLLHDLATDQAANELTKKRGAFLTENDARIAFFGAVQEGRYKIADGYIFDPAGNNIGEMGKTGATMAISLPQFESWWDKLKERGQAALKDFSVQKVPGFGPANGAIQVSYRGQPMGYLGFPLKEFESIVGPIQRWIEKGQEDIDPYEVAASKKAAVSPDNYEGSTIEEQVANLMEQRAFSEDEKGNGWAIYSRNTDYPDDGTWIKVFFKDGKVAKADMFDEEPDRVLDTRLGFEGLHSFTQAYGD